VPRRVGAFEEALDAAPGLANALLVLGKGEAHLVVAVFKEAETDARSTLLAANAKSEHSHVAGTEDILMLR